MSETWLPVVNFEGFYEVSDLGYVRSVTRLDRLKREWRTQPIKQHPGTLPPHYARVPLCRDGRRFTRLVHVLVAEAFLGPRPPGQQVRHGPNRNFDGSLDNSLANLSYGTASENQMDTIRDGTHLQGSQKPQSKLTEEEVIEIRRKYASGNETWRSLARQYDVSDVLIRFAVTGKTWTHVQDGVDSDQKFNRKCKLTDEDVREIRALYAAGGILNREIAKIYGVEKTTISRITSRAVGRR